ncbi:protein dispatched-related [Anaeramoeba flamelloides]|uniref:Protein dispatched-related n=1 Tax=Anaeramoeba flamelloides TaxID=1746091 RepID=A0ABQ8X860_9EUKA|nr:protein dispatched-related [Anaeramoeba flamelloides]
MKKAKKHSNNRIKEIWVNMPSIFVKYPKMMVIIMYSFAILLTVIAFGMGFELDSENAGFTIKSGEIADNFHGVKVNLKETYFDYESYEKETEKYAQQTQSGWTIVLYYECKGCDNLLTKERLAKIHQLEEKIQKENNYQDYCKKGTGEECNSPLSAIGDYYDEDGNQKSDLEDVSFQISQINKGALARMYFDKGFSESKLKTKYMRSIFYLGSPIEGYKNKLDNFDQQTENVEDYILGNTLPIFNEELEVLGKQKVDAYIIGTGITELYVNDLIVHDVSLVAGSIVMVFVYTWFHTKSFFLTSMGLLGVLLSFGCSFFIYRVILGLVYFNMMNFLALFIILGIGCDSLYIMLDAWRQSPQYLNPKHKNNLKLRMNKAYFRAAETMLITTITSVGAFFGNLASSIPAIKYFGFFTGIAIIFNYLFVITAFPSLIIIQANFESKKSTLFRIFVRCFSKKKKKKSNNHNPDLDLKEKISLDDLENNGKKETETESETKNETGTSTETETESEMEVKGSNQNGTEDLESSNKKKQKNKNQKQFDVSKLHALERYFYKYHSPFVNKYKYVLLVLFIGLAGFFSYQSSQLVASEDPSQFLPEDNDLMKAMNIEREEMHASSSISSANYVWGIAGIDRSGVDPLEPTNLGKVIYDKQFSIKSKEQQKYIITVCEKLRTKSFVDGGSIFCFMEEFRIWVTNETLAGGSYNFPVEEEDFEKLLLHFADYAKDNVVNKGTSSGLEGVPVFFRRIHKI